MKQKRVVALCMALMWMLLLSHSVMASEGAPEAAVSGPSFVLDYTNTLSDDETAYLEGRATEIENNHGVGAYVVIVDDYTSQNANEATQAAINEASLQEGGAHVLTIGLSQGDYLYTSSDETAANTIPSMLDANYEKTWGAGDLFAFITMYYAVCEKEATSVSSATEGVVATSDIVVSEVMDTADIITDEEEEVLRQTAQRIAEEQEVAVYILTLADYQKTFGAGDIYYGATDFYTEKGLGYGEEQNGVLLVLSMADRDYAYISYGDRANRIFSDNAKIEIEDEFLSEFAQNEWYDGFSVFLSDTEFKLEYPWLDGLILIAVMLLVGLVVAFFVVFGMYKQLKNVNKSHAAGNYLPSGGVNIQVKEDVYTHTTTRRVANVKSSGSGGGGGGRSFSGGGFSGRSGKF